MIMFGPSYIISQDKRFKQLEGDECKTPAMHMHDDTI